MALPGCGQQLVQTGSYKNAQNLQSHGRIDQWLYYNWLGHESLATTQKYFEPSKETEKQLEEMKLPF